MYFAFNNDFLKQWHEPAYVEKKRKEEEQKRRNIITRLNMESLEKCIKKNSIDELDRTKPYDKTFVCDGFISYTSNIYMNNTPQHIQEMKEFTEQIKPELEKMFIDYTENTKEISTDCNDYIIKHKFASNFIPKNTFTQISNFLVFRISNTNTNKVTNPDVMAHATYI